MRINKLHRWGQWHKKTNLKKKIFHKKMFTKVWLKIMSQKLKIFLYLPELTISFSVFFIYWFINKSYSGPAYLSDEIAYLTNAALLSGYMIDGASKYHAGYSLFLAPFFLIFTEPDHIWQAVIILNSFFWALSFFILAQFIKFISPNLNSKVFFLALLISAVYPSWITISGYAFATSAFILFHLVAIMTLIYWNPQKILSILPHSLAISFLYWIHPIGLITSIASFIAVGFVSISRKKYIVLAFHVFVVLSIIIVYKNFIQEYLHTAAILQNITVSQGDDLFRHPYPDYSRILLKFFNMRYLLTSLVISAGHLSYLIISSFGMVLFALIAVLSNIYGLVMQDEYQNKSIYDSYVKISTLLFVSLSLFGFIAAGSIFFSNSDFTRLDYWIYGRYTEMVILPFLPLGFLSLWYKWHIKWVLSMVGFLIFTGIVINRIAIAKGYNNLVNTISFWPQYIIQEQNFVLWMAAGSLLIIILVSLFNYKNLGKFLGVLIMITVFITSILGAKKFHENILFEYSKPTYFVEIVRNNYESGNCIGFNPYIDNSASLFHRERYYLYLFYFYDYAYRRMSPEDWFNNCDGPYFTYSLDEIYQRPGVKLIGQEIKSGLYLIARDNEIDIEKINNLIDFKDIHTSSGWIVNYKISIQGEKLSKLPRQVGVYKNNSIYSNNLEGYLLYGPYLPINTGRYLLRVTGDIKKNQGVAWVDLAANKGNLILNKYLLESNSKGYLIDEVINIDNNLLDLEIRIWVDEFVEMRIDHIELFSSEENYQNQFNTFNP